MPHLLITVDGAEWMNANTARGRGATHLPAELASYLQPGARPEPWMKAVIFTIAEAVTNDQDLRVEVTTKSQGWTVDVNTTPKHYEARADIWDSRNPGGQL